jgi:hypothetical protein
MLVGYARVSTREQNQALQLDALQAAGNQGQGSRMRNHGLTWPASRAGAHPRNTPVGVPLHAEEVFGLHHIPAGRA